MILIGLYIISSALPVGVWSVSSKLQSQIEILQPQAFSPSGLVRPTTYDTEDVHTGGEPRPFSVDDSVDEAGDNHLPEGDTHLPEGGEKQGAAAAHLTGQPLIAASSGAIPIPIPIPHPYPILDSGGDCCDHACSPAISNVLNGATDSGKTPLAAPASDEAKDLVEAVQAKDEAKAAAAEEEHEKLDEKKDEAYEESLEEELLDSEPEREMQETELTEELREEEAPLKGLLQEAREIQKSEAAEKREMLKDDVEEELDEELREADDIPPGEDKELAELAESFGEEAEDLEKAEAGAESSASELVPPDEVKTAKLEPFCEEVEDDKNKLEVLADKLEKENADNSLHEEEENAELEVATAERAMKGEAD